MFREQLSSIALIALLAACTAETGGVADGGSGSGGSDASTSLDGSTSADGGGGGNDGTVTSGLAESEKARVRFKRQGALQADFARALALEPAQICAEVGRYDCFGVHRVPLGGVEPYTLGINEPVEQTTVTTPLAVDRIALSGCRTRVDLDLAGDQAVIFSGLPVDGAGALSDPSAPEVRAAIDRLYQRFLQRLPAESEAAHLLGLYGDVTAASEPQPARAWAILSCFAVATSVEMLFY